MDRTYVDDTVARLEKASVELDPESLTLAQARELLAIWARVRTRADFIIAGLARRIDDATEVSKTTGTSMGKAKETIATGRSRASRKL